MADFLKFFGIWCMFCILASCVQSTLSVISAAACKTDKNCGTGFSMSNSCIQCMICMACLYFSYQTLSAP